MAATSESIGSADDHIFYNVLPADRSGGPLVNGANASAAAPAKVSKPAAATINRHTPIAQAESAVTKAGPAAITSTTVTEDLPHNSGKKSRRKLWNILAGIVILAVAAGAIYYFKFAKKATPSAQSSPDTSLNQNDNSQTQREGAVAGVSTPPEWQKRYFGAEVCADVKTCGDDADPDHDGLTNLEEQKAGTDPNNADSSGGGIADGDKVHVFGGDPLKIHSADPQYNDADYIKYGYNIATNKPFTAEELADIKAKVKQFGLHQPTISTIGATYLAQYDFVTDSTTTTNPDSSAIDPSIDQSKEAKLDRDTQRLDTIKKIGAALLDYKTARGKYPTTSDFTELTTQIKPYVTVATNFSDPINKAQFVYGYMPSADGKDFTLTYFSETQNLLIKYTAQNAQLTAAKETSNAFDDTRRRDLETLRTALLLYSSHNMDAHSDQMFVFPTVDKYKAELINGSYISQIPTDPRTHSDYQYTVSDKFDSFTLKATFDAPTSGTVGYQCTEDGCQTY